MDTITLRHIPGSCCPEKDCSVGSWDGKHCRSCGADCSKCPLNGLGVCAVVLGYRALDAEREMEVK